MRAQEGPFVCRAPFAFRIVGKTDSTNLRMHWHRGELIFNWECNVRDLRVHDPATAHQHNLEATIQGSNRRLRSGRASAARCRSATAPSRR